MVSSDTTPPTRRQQALLESIRFASRLWDGSSWKRQGQGLPLLDDAGRSFCADAVADGFRAQPFDVVGQA